MTNFNSPVLYEKVSPSFVIEVISSYAPTSIYDPFCGVGLFLNYCKHQKIKGKEIQVIGNELTSFGWMASKALNENNTLTLNEKIIQKLTNIKSDIDYAVSFEKWIKLYDFSEEQIKWLAYWRDVIDGFHIHISGMIMVAIFWMVNYWINRQKYKDQEIPLPLKSIQELMKEYLYKVNYLIYNNNSVNLVFHEDAILISPFVEVEAAYINFPSQTGFYKENLALALCEAWWQRQPELSLPDFYANRFFQKAETQEQYMEALQNFFYSFSSVKTWIIFYHPRKDFPASLLKDSINRIRKIEKLISIGSSTLKQVEKSYLIIAT